MIISWDQAKRLINDGWAEARTTVTDEGVLWLVVDRFDTLETAHADVSDVAPSDLAKLMEDF